MPDQEPSRGKLLVELIAWDSLKELFNFYELIGTGKGAQWFYRGDSADILADNALLYLAPQSQKFGSRVRCSACHTSGGPIMKELSAPHNDWWTSARPLTFGQNTLSPQVLTWMERLGDAANLGYAVKVGITRLEESSHYQNVKRGLSLQATLRPLFCETEINLESDPLPLDKTSGIIQIPSASIVNPILASGFLGITSAQYIQLLSMVGMQFPETGRSDADHGWLVPVKGYSDLIAIQRLISEGIVTDEFVADVLAVDLENPLFSSKRCGLISLVPPEGLENFLEQLRSSNLAGAGELYENLSNPARNRFFHSYRGQDHLVNTQMALYTYEGRVQIFKKLIEARQSVFDAEISMNPRGQILEPGFRVIFPFPRWIGAGFMGWVEQFFLKQPIASERGV